MLLGISLCVLGILLIGLATYTWRIKQKNDLLEKSILPDTGSLETGTIYNSSPVNWIKQNKRLLPKLPEHYFSPNSQNTYNFYIVETHPVTLALFRKWANRQQCNMLFFANPQSLIDFYNSECVKSHLNNRYLPHFIIASDLCGGGQIIDLCNKTPSLNGIKTVLISQNTISRESSEAFKTLLRPIKNDLAVSNFMTDLLRSYREATNQSF